MHLVKSWLSNACSFLLFPSVSFCFLLFPSVSFLISSTNRKEICRRREIKRPLQRAREREKRGGTRRNLTFSNWNTSFFSFYFFSIKERFLCDSEKRREEYQLMNQFDTDFLSSSFNFFPVNAWATDGKGKWNRKKPVRANGNERKNTETPIINRFSILFL